MTTPRRLSCFPSPAPGEAFTSWVARSAEFQQLPVDQMLDVLGVPASSSHVRNGVALNPVQLNNVVIATGLEPGHVESMLLVCGDNSGERAMLSWDWRNVRKRLPWLWRPRHSAVCPECVAQPPAVWKRRWRLVTTMMCEKHNIYLHSWCPSCRGPIQIGVRPRYLNVCAGPPVSALRWRSVDGRWRSSSVATRAHRCEQRWDELPRYPVGDDRLLTWQRQLTARLAGRWAEHDAELTFGRQLHMALRLAIQIGVLDMLGPRVDPPVWLAFALFQPLRDQMAVTAGEDANFQYSSLYTNRPGPMMMAAALSIIATLDHDMIDHPVRASRQIIDYYADRVATPEFKLLERALVSNVVFARAVVDEVKQLRKLEIGPFLGWKDKLPFVADPGVRQLFGKAERLAALGEWAMAMTSQALRETPASPTGVRGEPALSTPPTN